MNRTLLAGLAGITFALAGTAAADAATVTVRVEGGTATLTRTVAVDPAAVGDVGRNGAACNGTNTAAGALQLATSGDWSGEPSFGSLYLNTIRGEAYPLSQRRAFWGLYVNGAAASQGACETAVQAGDDVVFAASCDQATTGCATGGVLDGRGAATARPGEPYAVAVDSASTTFDPNPPYTATTTTGPAAGALVSGGGTSATTGADGRTTVTLTQRGPVELVVTKDQQVRDEVAVCVTDGADGYCGTTAPNGTTLPPEVGGTATGGVAGVTSTGPDKTAPRGTVKGIREGQRFSRKGAPRRLEASVQDSGGLRQVKLSLTRQLGKRCWAFSGKREAFRRARCGTHPRFVVGDRADVSYLLPGRLPKGRYVLDVVATDKAYNRDPVARGRNRVVFTVR